MMEKDTQPGDDLQLKIVREGKEADQGVGYLEDGTMVVVEDARRRIGERLAVTITGALQTPTGRMVFARCEKGHSEKNADKGLENPATKSAEASPTKGLETQPAKGQGKPTARTGGGKPPSPQEPLPPGAS